MEFVSVELGHRILETEEPQKPKNSTSEGTVISWAKNGVDQPRKNRALPWTAGCGTVSCPGVSWSRWRASSSTMISTAPHLLENSHFPITTLLKCPESPAVPRPPSPKLDHLYASSQDSPPSSRVPRVNLRGPPLLPTLSRQTLCRVGFGHTDDSRPCRLWANISSRVKQRS